MHFCRLESKTRALKACDLLSDAGALLRLAGVRIMEKPCDIPEDIQGLGLRHT